MQRLMNYIWLLNACANSLLEPNILLKEALEKTDNFTRELKGLKEEEKECLVKEIENVISYLRENRNYMESLEERLKRALFTLQEG
ncbi:MAG: hypothetical protein ACPLRZ_05565 [Thermovenabulum sp.]|uniref:hypothetical protein n=1 Tax=Thermovenabulum sp. TaxID=3100335 RepID=UPI003C7ECB27